MDNLNNLLNEYSKITDRILAELKNEEYDQINLKLKSRKDIINRIKALDYDSEDFKRLCISLNLSEKEENLRKLLEVRFNEKKEALGRISKAKHVNREYKKNYSVDSIFINKKI